MHGELPQERSHPHQPQTGPVPADFVRVSSRLAPGLDQKLGYRGDQRYVLFYHVPEAEGVIWQDAFAHGFGLGAWSAYLDHIAPLVGEYGADLVDCAGAGPDAVVIDRWRQEVYLAPRPSAEAFICGTPSDLGQPMNHDRPAS